IVEDDIYGFLAGEGPPPVSTFAPQNSIYINSLSKSVAPGLRVGYLHVPAVLHERLTAAMRATTWMAPPIMAELATRMVRSGDAARMATAQREEAKKRQAIAARHFAN